MPKDIALLGIKQGQRIIAGMEYKAAEPRKTKNYQKSRSFNPFSFDKPHF